MAASQFELGNLKGLQFAMAANLNKFAHNLELFRSCGKLVKLKEILVIFKERIGKAINMLYSPKFRMPVYSCKGDIRDKK